MTPSRGVHPSGTANNRAAAALRIRAAPVFSIYERGLVQHAKLLHIAGVLSMRAPTGLG